MTIFVNAYATGRSPLPLEDTHSYRGFATAETAETAQEFQEHLYGFAGYVNQLGMARFGTMTAHTFDTIDHINHTLTHYVFVRPDDYTPADLTEFSNWAQETNPIFFIQGFESVYNAQGTDLLVDGEVNVPHHPDSVARANEIRAGLAEDGIDIPNSLPPVRAVAEIFSQSATDVRNRIATLAVLSKAAGTLAQGQPLDFDTLVKEFAGFELELEPEEAAFVDAYTARRFAEIEEAAIQYQWAIIAADTLAWCLDATETDPADLESFEPHAIYEQLRAIPADAQLRDADEICDLYEWIRCLRWHHMAHSSLEPTEASICLERHHALTWVTDPFVSYEEVELNT